MSKYIALLRGINVGGHHKVPMAQLREQLTEQGLINVKTYIQSGNVGFTANNTSTKALEKLIHDTIESNFGFSISVLVKTREDIERIIADFPCEEVQQDQCYYVLLHGTPEACLIDLANEKKYEFDHYKIYNDCIYLYPEKGYGKTKFNMPYFERILKTSATARNHRTMLKLLSLHDE